MARAGKRMDNEAMESGLHCGTCGRVEDVLLWTAERQWTCRSCQQAPPAAEVAICTECGAKYRPAGGPCIHEQRSEMWAIAEGWPKPDTAIFEELDRQARTTGYDCRCAHCGVLWQPGHTCLRQPTTKEVADMREQAYWLRVMEDVLDHFGYETQLAAPAYWEAL